MRLENEEIIVTIIVGTILTLFFALIIVFLFVLFNSKNRLSIKERAIARKNFEESLLQSQLEIKEQTLRHIAYELHDNLGQVASLIKINLNTLQLGDEVKASQKIEDTKELVRQLIHDVKSLSISLNSDRVSQMGIVRGVESEAERLNKLGHFAVSTTTTGGTPVIDSSKTIIFYRMVQEILNNIVKHSEASTVTISMHSSEKMFTLVCVDNGVGFNVDEKIGSGGSGLTNLQNRAKMINAQVSIQSRIGEGTTMSIELPL